MEKLVGWEFVESPNRTDPAVAAQLNDQFTAYVRSLPRDEYGYYQPEATGEDPALTPP